MLTTPLLLVLLAARPAVQPAFRGEVETLDFAGHSTGVLATFEPQTPVAKGKAAVDACSAPVSGRMSARAAFLKTAQWRLAVVHPAEPVTSKLLLAVAACLSKQSGVKEAHAWFYPRVDSGVEVEAVWRFQQGVRLDRAAFSFRDDPEYARFARRAIGRAELVARQWKQWPLSDLVRKLDLPGRTALETPYALLWESGEFPADAGEDLARTEVFLPTGAALELLQEAEAKKVSTSSLMAEALAPIEKEKKLGFEDAPEVAANAQQRRVVLYLPRALLAAAEALGDARGESLSVILHKAWHHRREGLAKEKK